MIFTGQRQQQDTGGEEQQRLPQGHPRPYLSCRQRTLPGAPHGAVKGTFLQGVEGRPATGDQEDAENNREDFQAWSAGSNNGPEER